MDWLARNLDVVWDSLGSAERQSWEDAGDDEGWLAGCRWGGDYDFDVPVTTDDGIEVETVYP
jgi:hypothetical protein